MSDDREAVIAVARRLARELAPNQPTGWCWSERKDLELHLATLEAERDRRAGRTLAQVLAGLSERERLLYLLRLDELRVYRRERDRQAVVCRVLGLQWPPAEPESRHWCSGCLWPGVTLDGEHQHESPSRPWVWAWDRGPAYGRPVVYPGDWRPLDEPDRWGFAEEWSAGGVLVVPADRVSPPSPDPELEVAEVPAELAGVRMPPYRVEEAEGSPSPLLTERLARDLRRGSGRSGSGSARYRGSARPKPPVGSEGLAEYLRGEL